jgi:DNA gyrase/topoisomerase IV subunit B
MPQVLKTRREIEELLERGIVGRYVSYEDVKGKQFMEKVDRVAVWEDGDELMVIFHMNHRKHECDLRYFADNITIYDGTTHGRSVRSLFRSEQGDRGRS